MLTDQLERIRYGGDEAFVKRLSIRGLLPETDHYMTYDGSTTAPACPETVTWLVLNKPIYITKQQVCFTINSNTVEYKVRRLDCVLNINYERVPAKLFCVLVLNIK